MLNYEQKEQIEEFCRDNFGLRPLDEQVFKLIDVVGRITGDAVEVRTDELSDSFNYGFNEGETEGLSQGLLNESCRVMSVIEELEGITDATREYLIEAIES